MRLSLVIGVFLLPPIAQGETEGEPWLVSF